MLRRFCLLAGGLALAGALVACGGSSKGSSSQGVVVATVSGGATQPPAAAATPPASGATQPAGAAAAPAASTAAAPAPTVSIASNPTLPPELASLLDNFAKVSSYRAQISYDGGPNASSSVAIEAVAPDRTHFTATTNSAGGTLEVIIIGSDSYVKIAGSWVKQPPNSGSNALLDPKSTAAALNSLALATTTKGGTDSVNGKSCQLYTWTVTDTSYQVCIADGLPQRVVTQTATTKTTIVFSDYNAKITINAPI